MDHASILDHTSCFGTESTLFSVPDQVEDAIGRLIESLGHSSTLVRWSAAKGVGRVAERLPALCADDVLDAILETFDDVERDNCWHGGCLALAELARRGLLLPHRLRDVVPYVVVAIQYDLQRGHKSVGAHVRDAACYTYWAFARAYSPTILRPFLRELSESVMLTSLFDREVNCRRAASAAFQEAVGRQGAHNVPHGIEILTTADFFSLGNRRDAYTSIARTIAQFEEYRRLILRHLYTKKLFHWDEVIRELSSKSLKVLTSLDPAFIGSVALPYLMEKSLDPKHLQVRHGAVLGAAETILALGQSGEFDAVVLNSHKVELMSLVQRIEKLRLYRGRGGEIMRAAVCRLVECVAIAKLPMTTQEQVQMLDSVEASIPHPSESIQRRACESLGTLMWNYFPVRETGPTPRLQARVVDRFTRQVNTSDNPGATRGYALALGYLPAKLLAPSRTVLEAIITCLGNAARCTALVGGESDAETRRNALMALRRIMETVGIQTEKPKAAYPVVGFDAALTRALLKIYVLALEDYRSDKRGDVGCWCRVAALDGLAGLTQHVTIAAQVGDAYAFLSEEDMTVVVGAILKQLSEPLDSTRQKAGEVLEGILSAVSPLRASHHAELTEALRISNPAPLMRTSWSDPNVTFPRVLCASTVGEDEFFSNVVAGVAVSCGGLTKSVSKAASSALLDWVNLLKGTVYLEKIGAQLTYLLLHSRRSSRVSLPVLKTLRLLLVHKCFDDLVQSRHGSFANSCMEALAEVEQGCDDFNLLRALVDVAVALADRVDCGHRQMTVIFLCRMLLHRFPRVRTYAAEQLYVVLVDDATVNPIILKRVLETSWATAERISLKFSVNQILDDQGIALDFTKVQ